MISSISSFEIINVVVPDPNIILWITQSVVDVAAVNSNGIKTLLANGLSKFPIIENLLSNGSKSLPKILLIVLFHAIKQLSFWSFYISS